MLRMYCLLVGIDLSCEWVPDATTLLKFRRLLLANELTKALFDEVNAHLARDLRNEQLTGFTSTSRCASLSMLGSAY